jgi:hypothetical protein
MDVISRIVPFLKHASAAAVAIGPGIPFTMTRTLERCSRIELLDMDRLPDCDAFSFGEENAYAGTNMQATV